MRGTRVGLSVALAALLAPASAIAVPPTFTGTLEYGPDRSSLVASATITEGSAQYFEVWLNQPSGAPAVRTPTEIQFESNPPGIDGSCAGGIQEGRDFVACTPLTPNATAGQTVTARFRVATPYVVNGGAAFTMIAPPGGFANTTTVQIPGPSEASDPCEELEKRVKEAQEALDKADTDREKKKAEKKLKKLKRKLRKCKHPKPPGAPGK
jgi:hypothetical protein